MDKRLLMYATFGCGAVSIASAMFVIDKQEKQIKKLSQGLTILVETSKIMVEHLDDEGLALVSDQLDFWTLVKDQDPDVPL